MIDSPTVTCLSQATPKRRTVVMDKSGRSRFIRLFVTESFRPIIAATPTISKILAILDPTAFAVTTSVTPFDIATKDEISSGKDVPRPTITTPTTKGDMPRDKPIFSELPISQSALLTKTNKDTTKTTIQKISIQKKYKKLTLLIIASKKRTPGPKPGVYVVNATDHRSSSIASSLVSAAPYCFCFRKISLI